MTVTDHAVAERDKGQAKHATQALLAAAPPPTQAVDPSVRLAQERRAARARQAAVARWLRRLSS